MRPFFIMRIFLFTLLCISSAVSFGQKIKIKSAFVTWGYNRAYYLPSDIHVNGPDLSITFKDVIAADDPSEFSSDYYRPDKFTIPQFDFRFGVILEGNWRLSWGWEHMKYQVTVGEKSIASGHIGKMYPNFFFSSRDFKDEEVEMSKSLFYTEHTDGLNFINIEAEKGYVQPLFKSAFSLKGFIGIGTGPVTPWSDSYLFGEHYRNPTIHFAGWGLNLSAKPEIWFKDRVFLQFVSRVGQIWLWDVLIKEDEIKMKQDISFFEYNISVGVNFPIGKGKELRMEGFE